jgi:hypothetical protein
VLTISLSHLLERGVRLETHEAVALARELLAHPGGIPGLENIQLGSDGSASFISTAGMPSVASVARLLQTLLPAGAPHVPGPLRYAIARGLEAVEAPPFASLDEFSSALARFEHGASRDVLRGLLQRGARPSRPVVAPIAIAPTPVTTPAAPPAPVPGPTLVIPARPALVRKSAASSNRPSQPIAAPAPLLSSSAAGTEAVQPVQSWRRWALASAAAVVASFTAGFAVGDGITDRRAATQVSGSARVSPGNQATAPAANGSTANLMNGEPRDQTVRVPETPSVAREMVRHGAAAPREAVADAPSGPVAHVGDHVMPIQGVPATDANAFSPAFASDGAAIFFHTGRDRGARSAIVVATVASPTGGYLDVRTIVDDGSHNYHPQPSPDGLLVAFDSDRDGERGVYVANRDGSQVRRVSGAGYAAVPTWSRNNEWLAYTRSEAGKPGVWNLWMQPAAGGSARRLTHYRFGQTWAASWFPDDRRIAYSREDALVVMDLQTGETTRYPTPVEGKLVRTPAVSPDGSEIIFQVFRHGAWVLDLVDGSMQRVLADPTAEEFAWSPDGRRVAFHSRRDGQWRIYLLSRS